MAWIGEPKRFEDATTRVECRRTLRLKRLHIVCAIFFGREPDFKSKYSAICRICMYPFGTPCPGESSSRRGHMILEDVINGNVSSHGSLYDSIWQRIFDVASFLRVEWKRAYDIQPDAFVRIQDRHPEIGTTARTNRAAGANVPSFVLHSI